ncbi:MAG: T9SS type A sorting domain-containing protein [Saprospiraceae bacterium]|nr:T9SS type A sorting domain-containing protein [Saprospiraceae bacterium]
MKSESSYLLPKKNTVCRFKKQTSSSIDQLKLKIPTLVTNQLIIPEDFLFNHFDIYDMKGNHIKHGSERVVDLSSLLNGYYVLRMYDMAGVYSYKFIKQ